MSAKAKFRPEHPRLRNPFPLRQQFLDWGLVECRDHNCHMLINPDLLRRGLCTFHEKQRRAR